MMHLFFIVQSNINLILSCFSTIFIICCTQNTGNKNTFPIIDPGSTEAPKNSSPVITSGNSNPVLGSPSLAVPTQPNVSSQDADFSTLCVGYINWYRQMNKVPLLSIWKDAESCTISQAQKDNSTNTSHSSFGSCNELAQNECPNWPGDLKDILKKCLANMYAEGPGGGHYVNMLNTKYSAVACGYYINSSGKTWIINNFK